ncbi:hypothetical protein IscW_ISCW006100 [Ixodes scapularis]|uniref:Uncharacterized protein n=1 Tax=Ixodes scapularis TaxID=6945 RepID=B7PQH9_IXOSC|nr:hypothetical protein IscW_ISCW006100 [Ixodes scapularis]|eukprot:XP_002436021.1 hypothetical protein IscW_ISCW006100 [Ixodes scapularis]
MRTGSFEVVLWPRQKRQIGARTVGSLEGSEAGPNCPGDGRGAAQVRPQRQTTSGLWGSPRPRCGRHPWSGESVCVCAPRAGPEWRPPLPGTSCRSHGLWETAAGLCELGRSEAKLLRLSGLAPSLNAPFSFSRETVDKSLSLVLCASSCFRCFHFVTTIFLCSFALSSTCNPVTGREPRLQRAHIAGFSVCAFSEGRRGPFFFVGHPTERVQGTECQQEWGASMLMRQRLEPRVYFTSFFLSEIK